MTTLEKIKKIIDNKDLTYQESTILIWIALRSNEEDLICTITELAHRLNLKGANNLSYRLKKLIKNGLNIEKADGWKYKYTIKF